MARLTTEQEDQLFDLVKDFPERAAVIPVYPPPFPRGRVTLPSGRSVDITPPLPGAVNVPKIRLFPFTIRDATANASHRVSSPIYDGPAIVTEIQMRLSGGGAVNSVSWGLWADGSAVDVTNSDLALTADPPGIPIFDPTRGVGDSVDNIDGRFLHNAALSEESQSDRRWPVNIPVAFPRFRLHLSIRNNTAVITAAYGYIRLVEKADIEDWSPF